MATYSIADAKDHLSRLVRQAEQGEDVAITRHGKVVARLRPTVQPARQRPDRELVVRIVARARLRPRLGENAVEIVRRMRDGDRD